MKATGTRARFYNEDVAAAADDVTAAAIDFLLSNRTNVHVGRSDYAVAVVAAPAGAGKTFFVCRAAKSAVEAHPGRHGVMVIATPTNDQAYELVRRLAQTLPDHSIAFVPGSGRHLPTPTAAMANTHEVSASDAHNHHVIVATLDKLGDAAGRGSLTSDFLYLCIDEAYQAHSAHYFGVAALAPRHLLVGDPGQLDPFTTMEDADRWRGLAEDPTQTAVAVVLRNHPTIETFRLPVTRRLPSNAVGLVSAFYPNHPFEAWTLPGVRRMRFVEPAKRRGSAATFDSALDSAAADGWAYLRLPDSPVLTADPATIDVVTGLVSRLQDRVPEVASESTNGAWRSLGSDRVAVAVSHNDQKDYVRAAFDNSNLSNVRVDTANKLQGLEFDLLVAWHPLAGLPDADGFHLDPGRLCVMTTRHRHACIIVGRAGDAQLLEAVPPSSEAWLGHEPDPEVDGWFAHRLVFDQLNAVAVDVG